MMKRSMIASGVLHAMVIVAATVAWPHAIEQSDEVPSVVPVDLVTIADVTNIAPTVQEVQKPAAAPPASARPAETTVKGLGAQDSFTMDLSDALLAQMRECWNVPVGAPNPEQLIVQVRVFLAQDGSLAQPPLLEPASRAAAASNPYMRTAAEAALRAVNVCEPYKRLPPNKYDAWREIVMTFDPSKMIGR